MILIIFEVFAAAIAYADNNSAANLEAFITAFDVVKDLKGNCWKLTMTYWVGLMHT